KAGFLWGGASASDVAEALRWIDARGGGDPAKWPRMLTDLATELQRARLHGFTPREIQDAKAAVQALAERELETAPTRTAQQILQEINSSVASGEPVLSTQQQLDLYKQLLPSITGDEIS